MNSIFIRFPFSGDYKCFQCKNDGILNSDLRLYISSILHNHDFLLFCNGKKIVEDQCILPNATVSVISTLPGGKGGFGSMLRAIGAQIEKTTNREACRDLSGRRLRDINEEQRLKKWIASKAEREAEKLRRKKERLERMKSQPKHNFVDFEYEKEISELPERIDDALVAGIQKVNKRPSEVNGEPCSSKKKRLWFDEEVSSSSDSNSDSEKDLFNNLPSEPCKQLNFNENVTTLQTSETLNSEMPSTCSSNNVVIERDESCLFSEEENAVKTETSQQNSKQRNLVEVNETKIGHKKSEVKAPENTMILQSEINSKEKNLSLTALQQDQNTFINFQDYCSASDLESLGLEKLKLALIARGLKCGGSITDRAQRLWAVKDLQPHQYPKNMIAKPKK